MPHLSLNCWQNHLQKTLADKELSEALVDLNIVLLSSTALSCLHTQQTNKVYVTLFKEVPVLSQFSNNVNGATSVI